MEACLGFSKGNNKHSILIEGKDIGCYISSNDETLTEYSYPNCISANMIETVDCSGDTTRIPNEDNSICDPYNIIIHSIYDEDKNSYIYVPDKTCYTFKKDGWYRFTHFIIPTKQYYVNLGFDGQIDVDTLKENLQSLFGDDYVIPERIVVFDTEKYCFLLGELTTYHLEIQPLSTIANPEVINDDLSEEYIYKYYEWKEISFEDVICIANSNFTSTIKCYSLDIVNYSYLEEAYINKASELLKKYLSEMCSSNCNNFSKNNELDIQIRDYYWMALNSIKYANELENYCKALQLLNCVSQCGNPTDNNTYYTNINYNNGCNCYK